MNWRGIWKRTRNRLKSGRKSLDRGRFQAQSAIRSLLKSFGGDEWIDRAFSQAREKEAPDIDQLPVDFKLRQSSLPRRIYERVFPTSHVSRLTFRHNRDYLDDFMPIGPESYIGRGSYKFVYKLPWRMVVKVCKEILPSDPIIGSTYRDVVHNPDNFLSSDELALMEFLTKGRGRGARERTEFKFHRLGMERYHYARVREALPDLVLPTRFFMGMRFRQVPWRNAYSTKITPMDSQIMLVGKHLKEFARAGAEEENRSRLRQRFFPSFAFHFDIGRFGKIKKKVLEKIAEDFRRLIHFTEYLAKEEQLILDIHTENLIITLPEFQLKVFDFHLFDEHLYDPALEADRPEKDHVEVIEKFIESFGLESEIP